MKLELPGLETPLMLYDSIVYRGSYLEGGECRDLRRFYDRQRRIAGVPLTQLVDYSDIVRRETLISADASQIETVSGFQYVQDWLEEEIAAFRASGDRERSLHPVLPENTYGHRARLAVTLSREPESDLASLTMDVEQLCSSAGSLAARGETAAQARAAFYAQIAEMQSYRQQPEDVLQAQLDLLRSVHADRPVIDIEREASFRLVHEASGESWPVYASTAEYVAEGKWVMPSYVPRYLSREGRYPVHGLSATQCLELLWHFITVFSGDFGDRLIHRDGRTVDDLAGWLRRSA